MIYITGDTHGNFGHRFNTENFPEQNEMTKNDFVIICGDYGGIWDKEESKAEKNWFKWFEERSYTLLFVDGNHENFERLYEYPVKEWYGGKVHEIRPHILHLMRGQVFEIDGKKIFTFGGASSHDITGGILEMDDPLFRTKRKLCEKDYIPYRINHVSWWEQEMPSEEEMEEGRRNIEANDNSVDFIITHCCASSTQTLIGGSKYKPDKITSYLEEIKNTTKYKNWFFGHYHDNRNLPDGQVLIYEQMIRVS